MIYRMGGLYKEMGYLSQYELFYQFYHCLELAYINFVLHIYPICMWKKYKDVIPKDSKIYGRYLNNMRLRTRVI